MLGGYVKVKTKRFGELQINKEDILNFSEGILGFENLNKFIVVDPGDSTLILWLQSVDDESIAFPIIEPKIFKPDYTAKLLPADMRSVDLVELSDARIFCILTIPSNIKEMSANLKAPIVINNTNNKSRQIVLQDSKLSVKFEMYKELKQYIVSFASDDSKRTLVNNSTSETTTTAEQATASNSTKKSEAKL